MYRWLWIAIVAAILQGNAAFGFEFVVLSTPATDDLIYQLERSSLQSLQIGSFGGTYDEVSNLAFNGFGYAADRATDKLITLDTSDASILSAVQLDADVTKQGRGIDFSPQGVM